MGSAAVLDQELSEIPTADVLVYSVQIEAVIQNLTDIEDTVRVTVDLVDIQVVPPTSQDIFLGPRGVARATFRWDVARPVRTGIYGPGSKSSTRTAGPRAS